VTVTLPDKDQAVALARAYNQIAVFDLARFEEIEAGGTGEETASVPPEGACLPPLRPEEQGEP